MRSSDPPGRLTEPEAGRARKDRPMLRTFLSERGECPFDTVVSVCATAGKYKSSRHEAENCHREPHHYHHHHDHSSVTTHIQTHNQIKV